MADQNHKTVSKIENYNQPCGEAELLLPAKASPNEFERTQMMPKSTSFLPSPYHVPSPVSQKPHFNVGINIAKKVVLDIKNKSVIS